MFNHPRINRGGGRRKAEYNSQSTTSICPSDVSRESYTQDLPEI